MKQTKTTRPLNFNPSVVKASIAERIAFTHFKNSVGNLKITHISPVEGSDSWDLIYISANTEHICEIKIRDNNYQDWDYQGWMIEEYKYQALKALQVKSKRPIKIVYVNIFKNATVIWDLDLANPIFRIKSCNKMTVEDKGKINKSVAFLKSCDGTVYLGENDYEKITSESQTVFNFLFP